MKPLHTALLAVAVVVLLIAAAGLWARSNNVGALAATGAAGAVAVAGARRAARRREVADIQADADDGVAHVDAAAAGVDEVPLSELIEQERRVGR